MNAIAYFLHRASELLHMAKPPIVMLQQPITHVGPPEAYPNPTITPGALNPTVTQATIKKTIGVPGWTDKIRPPTSYTNALKRKQLTAYGYPSFTNLADLEEDHFIPLCCGGHPTNPKNLWPQRRAGHFGARTKDIAESAAQHAILNGIITLREAQDGFAQDWVALHKRLLANPKIVGLMMAMGPPDEEP